MIILVDKKQTDCPGLTGLPAGITTTLARADFIVVVDYENKTMKTLKQRTRELPEILTLLEEHFKIERLF